MSQTPFSPKAVLLARLGQPDLLQFARQAADLLGERGDGTRFLRLILFEADLPVPGGSEVRELVAQCIRYGWRAVPAAPDAGGEPQVGDLFVVTDAQRRPVRMGFVAKVGIDGGPLATAEYRLEEGKRYGRVLPAEIDYYLRLPG